MKIFKNRESYTVYSCSLDGGGNGSESGYQSYQAALDQARHSTQYNCGSVVKIFKICNGKKIFPPVAILYPESEIEISESDRRHIIQQAVAKKFACFKIGETREKILSNIGRLYNLDNWANSIESAEIRFAYKEWIAETICRMKRAITRVEKERLEETLPLPELPDGW